jgi:transposase-like protein
MRVMETVTESFGEDAHNDRVSARKVKAITEEYAGLSFSASSISAINQHLRGLLQTPH